MEGPKRWSENSFKENKKHQNKIKQEDAYGKPGIM
jgi:hypothetical protein